VDSLQHILDWSCSRTDSLCKACAPLTGTAASARVKTVQAEPSTENCRCDFNPSTVSILKKVKSLVDEIGSIELVRRALEELEDLMKRSP
jgi:hypothetical protein